ncbi:MAG: hypothetical protein Q8P67_19140 [archaeon]|nr:hypothetical protein [archaeon]
MFRVSALCHSSLCTANQMVLQGMQSSLVLALRQQPRRVLLAPPSPDDLHWEEA